jgi:hypothetical protein
MDRTDELKPDMEPMLSETRPQPPGPVGRPWEVEVDVYLESDGPDPCFSIYTSLPIDPSNGNIIFSNNHRPGFNIKFNLVDRTNSGYEFPPQPRVREACWSQLGNSCPRSPAWEVFDPRRVSNNGTTLEVYNQNPSPALGAFKYTLRVTNDGGASYCELDPGGTDQNGPSQLAR